MGKDYLYVLAMKVNSNDEDDNTTNVFFLKMTKEKAEEIELWLRAAKEMRDRDNKFCNFYYWYDGAYCSSNDWGDILEINGDVLLLEKMPKDIHEATEIRGTALLVYGDGEICFTAYNNYSRGEYETVAVNFRNVIQKTKILSLKEIIETKKENKAIKE